MKDSVGSINWGSVSQAYEPSQIDKPQNQRGLSQTESDQGRLSRSSSTSSIDESSSERDIRSLREARQGLRDAAKAKMTFGRFKNAVLSKLPFVGKTTYGRIMDRAAAADAPGLSSKDKLMRFEALRKDIQSWQTKHSTAVAAETPKAQALRELGVALRAACTDHLDLYSLLQGMERIPIDLDRPTEIEGDLPFEIAVQASGLRSDTSNKREDGHPAVANAFHRDFVIGEATVAFVDGSDTVRVPDDGIDAREALSDFTGSDEAAFALSHFIHQGTLSFGQGAQFAFKDREGGDLTLIMSNTGSSSFQVSRQVSDSGREQYVIDCETAARPAGFATSSGGMVAAGQESRLTCRLQITIDAADLHRLGRSMREDDPSFTDGPVAFGNGQELDRDEDVQGREVHVWQQADIDRIPFEVTQPPSFELVFEPRGGSLHRQHS